MPLHSLALTHCQGIGRIIAHRLVSELGSAAEVFNRRNELPDLIPDLQPAIVNALGDAEAMRRAAEELRFAEAHGISCLTYDNPAYPSRLRECVDAPIILFYQGTADLNAQHIVSVVGTRRSTDYGHQFCEIFMRDLARLLPGTLVVSGLAYGTDIHAHRAAMQAGLPTVAVLAHGLDRIYPPEHRQWALKMRENGGLLTEYPQNTKPDRFNFVSRNRIIAGLADATIVVESGDRGGALITAEMAADYNRECFAVPGRTTDPQSQGCNRLIRNNGATLIQSAQDLIDHLGWTSVIQPAAKGQQPTPSQRSVHGQQSANNQQPVHNQQPAYNQPVQGSLFPELTPEQELIAKVLAKHDGSLDLSTLSVHTNLSIPRLYGILMEMEIAGIVRNRAGGNVVLCTSL